MKLTQGIADVRAVQQIRIIFKRGPSGVGPYFKPKPEDGGASPFKEQEQTMWHTSCGNRTLHGAEARLFAHALLCLLDEAGADLFEDYDLDLPCFDQPMIGFEGQPAN